MPAKMSLERIAKALTEALNAGTHKGIILL